MTTQSHKPQIFPDNDNSWHDAILHKVGNHPQHRLNGIWKWHNKDGRIKFVKYRIDHYDENGKFLTKDVLPLSRFNNQWDHSLRWKTDHPLYNLPGLIETTKKVVVFEGEKTTESGIKLLPDYYPTTYSGGFSSWKTTDWKTLEGREVILFPDNDKLAIFEFNKIAQYLISELKCNAKVVQLPDGLPKKWDVADRFPSQIEIDLVELIESAKVPEALSSYIDLKKDIRDKRWVHIGDSVRLYWDRKLEKTQNDKNINLWYKNDPTHTQGQAVVELHRNTVDKVDSLSFLPVDQEIITEGNRTYINAYRKKKFPKIKGEYDISIFRNHLWIMSDRNQEVFDYLEDMLSHDVQKPYENRGWCLLLKSAQGVGKSVFFKIIEKLHGSFNCSWLETDELVDKYRPWLTRCYVVFVNEIDMSNEGKGTRRNKLAKLKNLIDGDVHSVEEKYINTFKHRCHYRLYLATNEGVPLDLARDDRRTMFVKINVLKRHLLEQDPDYFSKLWAFKDDDEKINEVHHHYKNVHKISDKFKVDVPLKTDAKAMLIHAGRDQAFKELDELFKSKVGVFKFDIVNSRDVYEQIQMAEQEQQTMMRFITERKITDWFNSLDGFNFPKPFSKDVNGQQQRWWALRNIDRWREPRNHDLMIIRAHFDGLLDMQHDKREQAKLFDKQITKGGVYAN